MDVTDRVLRRRMKKERNKRQRRMEKKVMILKLISSIWLDCGLNMMKLIDCGVGNGKKLRD